MSERVLLDFNNFSLERFVKVQGILQPAELNVPLKSRSATSLDARHSKPVGRTRSTKDMTDRIEFARKVVNSTLSMLDSWKADQPDPTKARTASSKKYLYESAALAFNALYEEKTTSSDAFDVEKRQISFILKLIDVQMVDQAMRELNSLAQHILAELGIQSKSTDTSASTLLTIPIFPTISESTANVVILSQIALLKALSKYTKRQAKPIPSSVSQR